MTREEAIKQLQNIRLFYIPITPSLNRKAIDMAIQALQEPEIVRCEDCKYKVISCPEFIADPPRGRNDED